MCEGEIDNGILKVTDIREVTEEDKAKIDAANFGTGFMKDGKHVPLNEVYAEPTKQAEQNFRVNLVPTHDPYTNPNAYLYYECECGQRLDPNVKSFASLNNHASDTGWKIRWGAEHYVPYCPKCAEEKEIK